MPLDFSIPQRSFANQFDPAQAQQRAMTMKSMMDEQKLRGIQTQDALEERGRKRTMRDLMAGAIGEDGQIDSQKLRGAFVQTGDAKGLMEYDTNAAQQAKAAREARLAEIDGKMKETGYIAQLVGTVRDEGSWRQALSQAKANGLDTSQFDGAAYSPELVSRIRAAALTESQRLEQEARQFTQGLQVAQLGETRRHNSVQEGISAGQLSVAQFNATKPDASMRPPSGYRFKPDGTLEAVPGGPGEKKDLTQDQGQASGHYRVMREALGTLNKVKGYNPTLIANALDAGDITGTKLSQTDRRVLNAQRAFVVSALRLESGATYQPSEVVDKIRTLFPMPNDGPEALADKSRLREQFAMSAVARAGSGLKGYVPSDRRSGGPGPRNVAGGSLKPDGKGGFVWSPN